jgi:hypothetical protein
MSAMLLSGVVLLLPGCGSGPRLYDIPGSITVDGQPADGATLLFHPEDLKKIPWTSTANVDPDGTFKVITDMKPGIPAGKFKVTLTWPDPSQKPSAGSIASGSTEDPPDMLKGAFASTNKSDLSIEVTSDMKALPPIEIKTK